MDHPLTTPAGPPRMVTGRAVAVGAALLPLNALFLVQMEMGRGGGPYPSTFSLFANVVLLLALLVGAGRLLARVRPTWVLSSGELLTVYAMLTVGTAIASVDGLDVLLPMMGAPERFATDANRWRELLLPHLPPGFIVRDRLALNGYYEGHSTLYTARHLRAWAGPVAHWSAFCVVLCGTMGCLAYLVRRRWIEHERLPFPILGVPLQMVEASGGFWRLPALWAGFALAALVSLLNGVSFLVPAVPELRVKYRDLGPAFVTPPWNALGWTPVSFYPFAVGLGYLLPVDLLGSCWFFYAWFKVERVLGAQLGLTGAIPRFPYVEEQCVGGYLAVAVAALWTGRRCFGSLPRSGERGERLALAGLLAGVLALAAFYHRAGLGWGLALVAFGLYFAIALACARMRAELGPPAHDLHNAGPERLLTTLLGSGAFRPPELVALTWFYWFNRAYRSIAIAPILESFKLAERQAQPARGLLIPLATAIVVGTLSGFWAHLHLGYEAGLQSKMAPHLVNFGREAFGRLDRWLLQPAPPDQPAFLAIVAGLAQGLLLQACRLAWARWPWHPLGLAVAGSWSMGTIWLPLLIAWAVKAAVLRYGGIRAYRQTRPFFIGLVLGDYLLGCSWPIFGALAGVPTYSFQQ